MRLRNWTLAIGLGIAPCAFAQDVDADDEMAEQTFTGKRIKPIGADLGDQEDGDAQLGPDEQSIRPYPDKVYEGARVLNMDIAFVAACHEAVELVYRRDYPAAKSAFEQAGRRYPGTALAPIGRVLVYQAMMLENLDFKYESQYELAARQARQQLAQALEIRGNDAWENFILGGVLGIDAIHTMRKGQFLTALNRGIEAMKAVDRAKELAPEFPDTLLGDGLYNYWRTVITRSVKGLPDYGDKRSLGIEQMRKVQEEGIFLGPAATFALTYTWLEEGALRRAIRSAKRNRTLYPDNVVNNLMLGRLYMYKRDYGEAEHSFKKVLEIAPDNMRVHYFLTRLYLRIRRLEGAELHINTYLKFDLTQSERALALYPKGLVYYRRKDYAQAQKYVQQAWELGKLKRAKRRLQMIERMRKRG
jgi:tetratricopeptide (TPR) repeat protein